MDDRGETRSLSSSRQQRASDEVSSWEAGSFRDPGGSVFLLDGKVYRAIHRRSWEDWIALSSSPLYKQLQEEGLLISTQPVSVDSRLPREAVEASEAIVEHERVPFVSYPYEWSFTMLKDAALLHLDLVERALAYDLILKDASAFNVQFIGGRPVFIDVLSFARLSPGEPWIGYNQFCKMFLYPLMLQAYKGVPFQTWLRSELEGFDPIIFSRLLGWRDLLRRGVFTDVYLQAVLQDRMEATRTSVRRQVEKAGLPKKAIVRNVRRLRRLVGMLRPQDRGSPWIRYTENNSYTEAATSQKEQFVRQIIARGRHRLVWDLGCNIGNFSRLTSEHADYVVALDSDDSSIEHFYNAIKKDGPENILPLVMNLANLSPDQGWAGHERRSLLVRGKPDLVICLALIHHMTIRANVPAGHFFAWLAGLEASLIIEFVSKADPMVRQLLINKKDTYDDYSQSAFERSLKRFFRIGERVALDGGTRFLYYALPTPA